MPSVNTSIADNIRIFLDGINIASATSMDITRSRTVNKLQVIGSPDQRISDGAIEITGSITELKSNDLGFRLVRSKTLNNVDVQPQYWDGASDLPTGENTIQHTLNSVTTSVEQQFTATGKRLENLRLLMSKTGALTEDITITVKTLADATVGTPITLLAEKVDANKFWTEIDLTESTKITGLTVGTQYKLAIAVNGATSGELYLWGNERQPEFLVHTAVGGEGAVDLNHTTVDSDTLFVRVNADGYRGQDEGYTFSDGTGTAGVDQIVFSPTLTAGDEVYVSYEYDDGVNNPFAWRLAFGEATSPTYTIRFDEVDSNGKLLDSYEIEDVIFSSNGRSISPDSFVERTLQFEGQSEKSIRI